MNSEVHLYRLRAARYCIFRKLAELCRFVTYLSNDPRMLEVTWMKILSKILLSIVKPPRSRSCLWLWRNLTNKKLTHCSSKFPGIPAKNFEGPRFLGIPPTGIPGGLACYCLILVCTNGKRTALLKISCHTCLLVLWNVLALCMRLLLLEKVDLRWSMITSVEKRLMIITGIISYLVTWFVECVLCVDYLSCCVSTLFCVCTIMYDFYTVNH